MAWNSPTSQVRRRGVIETNGKLLTKNWILNLGGQVFPLLVGLATVPYVIRSLGTERFGILSIAWVLLGYFGLFDLGMGRATTKFAAECLGRGDVHRLPGIVWTTFWFQTAFGVLGTVIAMVTVPLLVNRFLKISPSLIGETKFTFFILAASLPIVLGGNTFRGLLEAAQRFDIVNYVRVPANLSIFVLPAVAVPLGLRLPGIVLLLVAARIFSTAAYLLACLRLFPVLRQDFSFESGLLRPLFTYGGWVTVSNVVGPILIYVDRFLVGSIISMTAVGYYTAPYEAVTRALVVPGSLTATLFPAFANLDEAGFKRRSAELCARSVKSLLLFMGPLLLLVAVFAQGIVRLWLGAEFERHSTVVLQILSLGVLVNSLTFVPFSLLQAVGRPDLTGKFHLLELPFYVGVCLLLLHKMGLPGAALAWTLRAVLDAALLFAAAFRLEFMSFRILRESGLPKTLVAVLGFGTLLALFCFVGSSLLVQALFASILLLIFAIGAWVLLLDREERSLLLFAVGRLRAAFGRAR
jgi:O-antigen/teichoic acid export membrane protein